MMEKFDVCPKHRPVTCHFKVRCQRSPAPWLFPGLQSAIGEAMQGSAPWLGISVPILPDVDSAATHAHRDRSSVTLWSYSSQRPIKCRDGATNSFTGALLVTLARPLWAHLRSSPSRARLATSKFLVIRYRMHELTQRGQFRHS